ncbi:MAG: Crp/Fnr family transcriptional regulator [Bacteroidia bacterium]|nr:Crp/Fnr family transcriptional regulator [Bacteroidia bacterium]MBT8269569.1 Crp/Fnr family transcriptional regulator [Bacteroidia bacterium]NNF82733.1 Crp/Fnr family transcriptional regulator [Flavobacteriaceae bacterium]NNK69082.1 Crp/Fnr family transcriptional regulator [Flavobacteriaceae bacterium]NNL80947.1 Crp/Fnr family transcriptional regulator [Flavobacteriaceae bacterium]
MLEDLKVNYGYLFEDELMEEIQQIGQYMGVPEGTMIIDIGDTITSMPLILNGAIKVLREDDKGDDLLLYFIENGDTCAMTITCCMGDTKSGIRAIAETDTELIMVPVQKMQEWFHKYKSWQTFVLQSYHTRMNELLEAVDAIAFLKMDERLLKYLRDKAIANRDELINTTHQEIAYDLHTSRVVVSRILKKLERDNQIQLHRNRIKILNL